MWIIWLVALCIVPIVVAMLPAADPAPVEPAALSEPAPWNLAPLYVAGSVLGIALGWLALR